MTDKKDNEEAEEAKENSYTSLHVGDLSNLPEPLMKEILEWQGVISENIDLDSEKPQWHVLCRILALYKYQIEALHEVAADHREKLEALAESTMKISGNIHHLIEQLNEKWGELSDDEKEDGDWWKR